MSVPLPTSGQCRTRQCSRHSRWMSSRHYKISRMTSGLRSFSSTWSATPSRRWRRYSTARRGQSRVDAPVPSSDWRRCSSHGGTSPMRHPSDHRVALSRQSTNRRDQQQEVSDMGDDPHAEDRARLADEPRPAMPEDVAARLHDALANEADSRRTTGTTDAEEAATGPTVTPLPRRGRWTAQLLGAAGVVAVEAIDITVVNHSTNQT